MLPSFATILRALPEAPAAAASSTPSNQQIVDAAKSAYGEYQSAVDAMTIALVNSVADQSLDPAIQRLDGTNWQSAGVSPKIADPFWSNPNLAAFLKAALQSSNLQSASIGVFVSQLPGSPASPGMVGFARTLSPSTDYTGVTLALDIFSKIVNVGSTDNLQYGLWLSPPDQIHDVVTGLFISTVYQSLPVILKILLTNSLAPYGFAVSSGTSLNLPVNTGVFAGKTAQWQF